VMVLLLLGSVIAQPVPGATARMIASKVVNILCSMLMVIIFLAAGIAIIVVVLAGIKWSSAGDDPGARKQARDSVIHAIIGLIIVIVAAELVAVVIAGTDIIVKRCVI